MAKPSKLKLLILEVLQENPNLFPNKLINVVSEKHRLEYRQPMNLNEYEQIITEMIRNNTYNPGKDNKQANPETGETKKDKEENLT